MPNPFAHVELSTDDVKKAKKFYTAVFAWKLNDLPDMSYTIIDVAGGTGGGMMLKPAPDAPTAWLPYVQVDDVNATMAKVVKAGGKVVMPYQEIGEMGAIGVFVDPSGAALGLWAAKPGSPAAPPPPEPKKSAKKAPAKAAAPAKKAPSKKAAPAPAPPPAPAKNAPAKKAAPALAPAPAKKAPAKKAAPALAPAKKAPAKKTAPAPAPAPAKKAPAKKR